ncbi:TPA: hypothetical protein ACF24Q_005104 [Klebsiella pneumoniae]
MAKKKTFSFAHLIGRGATASEEEEDKKAKKAKGRRAEEDEREDDAEDDEREDDAEDDERDDDASTHGDQSGGLYLMGEFNQNHIIFDTSWTAPELKTALRPLAIFLKDSAQAPLTTS